MFEEKISTPAVQEYFATLGLDVWDATWAKMLRSSLEVRFLGQISKMSLGEDPSSMTCCAMMPMMWELGP